MTDSTAIHVVILSPCCLLDGIDPFAALLWSGHQQRRTPHAYQTHHLKSTEASLATSRYEEIVQTHNCPLLKK